MSFGYIRPILQMCMAKTLLIVFFFAWQSMLAQSIKLEQEESLNSVHLHLINAFHGPVKVLFQPKKDMEEIVAFREVVVVGPLDTIVRVVSISKSVVHGLKEFDWKSYLIVTPISEIPMSLPMTMNSSINCPLPKVGHTGYCKVGMVVYHIEIKSRCVPLISTCPWEILFMLHGEAL